jgi:hypothetical protein
MGSTKGSIAEASKIILQEAAMLLPILWPVQSFRTACCYR